MYLTNLELTHPGAMDLIESGICGVARTLIQDCLVTLTELWKRLWDHGNLQKDQILLFLLFW